MLYFLVTVHISTSHEHCFLCFWLRFYGFFVYFLFDVWDLNYVSKLGVFGFRFHEFTFLACEYLVFQVSGFDWCFCLYIFVCIGLDPFLV